MRSMFRTHAPLLRTVDRFSASPPPAPHARSQPYHDAVIDPDSYLGEVFVRNLGGWWHFPDVIPVLPIITLYFIAERCETDAALPLRSGWRVTNLGLWSFERRHSADIG